MWLNETGFRYDDGLCSFNINALLYCCYCGSDCCYSRYVNYWVCESMFVINSKSERIHLATCSYVKTILKENKKHINKISIDELSAGLYKKYSSFKSCKRCKADIFQTTIQDSIEHNIGNEV